ncbi:RusA family crossover junction endodeoxyribonuclease [Janthinobacterium sp. J1-1]|uniref:RusA family crossover junction endodeoxyribonuclease n=1 Tax=Janthinobacterium sp. J1-1 TaxID=3065910 RepID=UPI0028118425|nr:RusA family crossover junction endodeoxyribonuclease [Janthinobacterium sp. J1-1]
MQVDIWISENAYSIQSITKWSEADRIDYKGRITSQINAELLRPENLALMNAGLLPCKDQAIELRFDWFVADTNLSPEKLMRPYIYEHLNVADLDNAAKFLIDQLQGVVIGNDRQIVRLLIEKRSIADIDMLDKRHQPTRLRQKILNNKGIDLLLLRVRTMLSAL